MRSEPRWVLRPQNPSRNVRRDRAAFTLIELMIVIAIIAIVAAVAIPSLQRVRISANETRAVSTIRTIISAVELYRTRYGNRPSSLADMANVRLLDDRFLASPVADSGYTFGMILRGPTAYSLQVLPQQQGATGDRWFYYNTSPSYPQGGVGSIHQSTNFGHTWEPLQ